MGRPTRVGRISTEEKAVRKACDLKREVEELKKENRELRLRLKLWSADTDEMVVQ